MSTTTITPVAPTLELRVTFNTDDGTTVEPAVGRVVFFEAPDSEQTRFKALCEAEVTSTVTEFDAAERVDKWLSRQELVAPKANCALIDEIMFVVFSNLVDMEGNHGYTSKMIQQLAGDVIPGPSGIRKPYEEMRLLQISALQKARHVEPFSNVVSYYISLPSRPGKHVALRCEITETDLFCRNSKTPEHLDDA